MHLPPPFSDRHLAHVQAWVRKRRFASRISNAAGAQAATRFACGVFGERSLAGRMPRLGTSGYPTR